MIRLAAAILLVASLLAAPLRAQEPSGEAVFDALVGLLDRGADRQFFGLPEAHHWRPAGPLRIGLYSAQFEAQSATLSALSEQMAAACGQPIELVLATDPYDPESVTIAVVPELEIVVGPRSEMARLAGGQPVNLGALERFEDGRWPFIFNFERDESRIGQVWIADDEPPKAVEAALILSLFWALGTATLGGELAGLIDRTGSEPALTPLGQEVLRVLCDPAIEGGWPIPRMLQRVRSVLELDS